MCSASTNKQSLLKYALPLGDFYFNHIVCAHKNGSIKSDNVKATYNGTKWSTSEVVNYSPSYQYYAYYPYTTNGLAHLGASSSKGSITAGETSAASGTQATNGARAANATRAVPANTSASDFFASGISAFTPATNQSTAANFNASDLQVGKATISRTTADDITFDLTHQMGLAQITLATVNDILPGNTVYDGNTGTITSGSAVNTTLKDVTASSDFLGAVTPYKYTGKIYSAIVSPNSNTVFNSQSGVEGAWTAAFTASPAANTVVSFTANPVHGSITWNYDFSGEVKELTVPHTGTYKLQVWGAQSGGYGYHSNFLGGYGEGDVSLQANSNLYICVGGKGYDTNLYTDGTSYNGGGVNTANGNKYGGGGATHIASMSGLLRELADHKQAVYIVAGGAGTNGMWSETPSSGQYSTGGGETGGDSYYIYYIHSQGGATGEDGIKQTTEHYHTGGTQTGCGADGEKGGFGYGGGGLNYIEGDTSSIYGAAAGGGGWYGGNGTGTNNTSPSMDGGGGSGYIGGVTNGSMQNGVREGNGYARITFMP